MDCFVFENLMRQSTVFDGVSLMAQHFLDLFIPCLKENRLYCSDASAPYIHTPLYPVRVKANSVIKKSLGKLKYNN